MEHNIRHILLFLLLSLLSGACSDETYYDYLSLTPRMLGIGYGGELQHGNVSLQTFDADKPQVQTIRVEAQNVSWGIENPADWITLSSTNGTQSTDITITAARNATEDVRETVLKLVSQEPELPAIHHIAVTQAGHAFTLSLSPTIVNATAKGATYSLKVNGDAVWSASVNVEWCTLGKLNGIGSDNLNVTVKDNVSNALRTATITIVTNKSTLSSTLTQAAGQVPVVSAVAVSDIQKYSFTASATYTSDFEVTECGFCYSQTNNTPTLDDTVVKSNTLDGIAISGLSSARTYYIRAYAKSVVGIGYGEVKVMTTRGVIPGEEDNGMPST